MTSNINIDFNQVGKIVCVGRNYAAHAQELNNPIPSEPLLFIKPNSTLVEMEKPIHLLPEHKVHFELELAILIGKPLNNPTPEQAFASIDGFALALDLTLRDVQSQLKQQGKPWERAKSFVGACPVAAFIPPQRLGIYQQQDMQHLCFSLHLNQRLQQQGQIQDMLFSIPFLLQNMAQAFGLKQGDIVLTGTPEGVGQLHQNDKLECRLWHTKKPELAYHIKTDIV